MFTLTYQANNVKNLKSRQQSLFKVYEIDDYKTIEDTSVLCTAFKTFCELCISSTCFFFKTKNDFFLERRQNPAI